MLAKLWKNILLAICIIAILFNITSKLIRRYSLDEQLNSVVGGESLSEVIKDNNTSDTTDNKSKKSKTDKNSSSKNTSEDNNDDDEPNDEEEYLDSENYEEDYEDEYESEYEEDSQDTVEVDIEENEQNENYEFDQDGYFINFNEVVQDYVDNFGF